MNGKGSKPRPFSVDRQTFENNWNAIFGTEIYQDMYDETYNPLINPIAMKEPYSGINWIKNRAKLVEIGGNKYVSEEHYIAETTFLIEEIRKLAKWIKT
jgi:hypothetical protein